jgi:hypothetical protein
MAAPSFTKARSTKRPEILRSRLSRRETARVLDSYFDLEARRVLAWQLPLGTRLAIAEATWDLSTIPRGHHRKRERAIKLAAFKWDVAPNPVYAALGYIRRKKPLRGSFFVHASLVRSLKSPKIVVPGPSDPVAMLALQTYPGWRRLP